MSEKLLGRLAQLGAGREALDGLRALVQETHAVPAGGAIARQSLPATHLHVLENGWACRTRTLRDGRRQAVALVLDGEIADPEALTLGTCSCEAAALSACRVRRIPIGPLRDLLGGETTLAAAFQRLYAAEHLVATEWMVNLGRRSAIERIAHLICEVAVRLDGVPRTETVEFPLPVTQSDLADAAGLSVVHVNRSLQTLRGQIGLVLEKRRVTIPSWSELVSLAEFDPGYLSAAPELLRTPEVQRVKRS